MQFMEEAIYLSFDTRTTVKNDYQLRTVVKSAKRGVSMF